MVPEAKATHDPCMVMPFEMAVLLLSVHCLTLCDPMDYTVHGILQDRILERVAFPFSK